MALVSVIVLSSFLCGFAVLLNLSVVMAIVSKGRSKDMRDIILMSLAVCDCVQCTLGYPNEVYGYINEDRPTNEKVCKASGFIVLCLALTALSHLVSLCIYRYITIAYPLKIQNFFTSSKKSALYFIIPSWIYGLFWSASPLLGWNEIVKETDNNYRCTINMYPDDSSKRSYLYALLVFCYCIPVAVIFYCTLKVHLELRNMLKLCKADSGEEAVITKATYKLARQDFISAFLTVTSFFIVWSPYALCVFFLSLGRKLPKGFLSVCALFAKLSTILNPIIYCLMYKEFRQTIRRKIRRIFRNATVAPQ